MRTAINEIAVYRSDVDKVDIELIDKNVNVRFILSLEEALELAKEIKEQAERAKL